MAMSAFGVRATAGLVSLMATFCSGLAVEAADITGTSRNDVLFFQGNVAPQSTIVTNPYTGEAVSLSGNYNENTMSYEGLAGIDTLFLTNSGDLLFIRDPDSDQQMVFNMEVFFAGDGSDAILLADTTYSLTDLTIVGGGADDILWSNIGSDVVNGNEGDDLIDGGPGNDVLNGGNGTGSNSDNDSLRGGLGNDDVNGEDGNDRIFFDLGDGMDSVDGGADLDEIVFGPGITLAMLNFTPISSSAVDISIGSGGDKISAMNVELLRFDDDSTVDPIAYATQIAAVPEPSALTLFAIGLLGLGFAGRCGRRKATAA